MRTAGMSKSIDRSSRRVTEAPGAQHEEGCLSVDPDSSLSVLSLAHAGFDDGKAAYDRGDYATAFKEFKSLAGQGDAGRQFSLGAMCQAGLVVPQDYGEALKWYCKSVDQGVAGATFSLGNMYFSGHCIPHDNVEAYMWFNLSATQGHTGAEKRRGSLAGKMTVSQIAEAQSLARK